MSGIWISSLKKSHYRSVPLTYTSAPPIPSPSHHLWRSERSFQHAKAEPVWRSRISILNRKAFYWACPSVFPLLGLILRSSIPQWAAAAERCPGGGEDSGPEITLSAPHNNTAVDTVLCQELSGFWFTFPPLSSNRRPGRPFRAHSRG